MGRRKVFACSVCGVAAVLLLGCSNDLDIGRFTPEPPAIAREDITTFEVSADMHPSLVAPQDIEPAAGTVGVIDAPHDIKASLDAQTLPAHCKPKHRFDRKALIAYEWGDSRLAFDVDGLNMTSTNIEAATIKYRYRFSPDPKRPYKTKREKCRYQSGWQGMLGSGYNEFFLREEDTVYKDVHKLINDLDDGFGKTF
ncbi:hypothetical protein N9Z27_01390 [Alphaproteobacteria bacterium]|nr:hypothetical protein [Alphaproteobacteria bacterium]